MYWISHGRTNHLISAKKSKGSGKKNNSSLNYFRKPNSIIPRFTGPVDHEKE